MRGLPKAPEMRHLFESEFPISTGSKLALLFLSAVRNYSQSEIIKVTCGSSIWAYWCSMNSGQPFQAKIVSHTSGLGAPTSDDVERRAQELAHINGRSKHNSDDWEQAKRELHGGHESANDDESDEQQTFSGRDMMMTDSGHRVQPCGMDDDKSIGEELVSEGMDEAAHEQMLEASRRDEKDTEETL